MAREITTALGIASLIVVFGAAVSLAQAPQPLAVDLKVHYPPMHDHEHDAPAQSQKAPQAPQESPVQQRNEPTQKANATQKGSAGQSYLDLQIAGGPDGSKRVGLLQRIRNRRAERTAGRDRSLGAGRRCRNGRCN